MNRHLCRFQHTCSGVVMGFKCQSAIVILVNKSSLWNKYGALQSDTDGMRLYYASIWRFYLQSFNQKRATSFKACENLRRIGGVENYIKPSCSMIMYIPIKLLKGTHWKYNREFGQSIARCVQGYWCTFVWELSYDMHMYILDTFII